MRTTVYQKFISRYAETFTLVDITEGDHSHFEVLPLAKFQKLNQQDAEELIVELWHSDNEKSSWSDGEEEFDEEDARAAAHQKWDEINSDFDKMGI